MLGCLRSTTLAQHGPSSSIFPQYSLPTLRVTVGSTNGQGLNKKQTYDDQVHVHLSSGYEGKDQKDEDHEEDEEEKDEDQQDEDHDLPYLLSLVLLFLRCTPQIPVVPLVRPS